MHPAGVVCSLVFGMAAVVGRCSAEASESTRYLPADTEVVAFVNVRQLVDAPLVKKRALEPLKAAVKKHADAQHFLSAAGLDPLQDIQGLLIAGPGSKSTEQVLVIMKGNFDLARIGTVAEEFARKYPKQLVIHDRDGARIYEGKSSEQPASVFVRIVDRHTMLLSPSRAYLLQAIKEADRPEPKMKKELQLLLDKTDSKQSLWLVALVTPDMRKVLGDNRQTANLADKISHLTGNILITDEVRAIFRVQTTDARAAQAVERILEGVRGIVQLAALDMEEYGKLILAILAASEVRSEQTTVTFDARISESVLQKGLAKEK